ncbi:SDR family NAD(P)-dependent oxidoreductase [Gracilibacillus alcaliphilus]|uniref:SDR family NAD(P)-dependent oxidoreductase n=1 Tax=Gracilibacillus alcaliphilus TaxID=1401441 RepID=UPI001EF87158|nr:SDR family NAD(P)-dependent oxidoreductase [Gracilibacillus alcaliphilus]MBM7676797.1 3-oxoacyl-[acyl-carrier protein] reductase [Gracilibacillus alcaliphilus]
MKYYAYLASSYIEGAFCISKGDLFMFTIDLTGKVAIVTGGANGIGKAIVEALRYSKAKVAVVDLHPHEEETEEELFHIQADVSNKQDVAQMMEKVINRFGKVDILVNNAGISTMDYFVDIKENDWDKTMDINAKGVQLCSQAVAKKMKEQGNGGKIIHIASQAGKNGYRLMGAYVASKHAVVGLTKVMAIELAQDQINVNAVCPGIIETSMKHRERIIGGQLRGLDAEAIRQEDASQVPLGRTGTPEDVAYVVLFLASRFSGYMTGQAINVTGGMTMH